MRQKLRALFSLTVFYLFSLLAPALNAQNIGDGAADATATQAIPKRGALFKIRAADHTLYLFGTIHVGRDDFYPLEPQVMQALAQSTKLALEIDPLGDPAVIQKAMAQYAFYANGKTSAADIGPRLRARLEPLLQRYGMQYNAVANCKPWMLSVILAIAEFSFKGYQGALAVDAHLSKLAQDQQIPVLELESMDSQMALFGKLPMAQQIKMLEDSVDGLTDPKLAGRVVEIADLWSKADAKGLDALAREVAEDKTYSGRLFKKMALDARNPGLAGGMLNMLKTEKNSFAAIGILHLVGSGSVPELLRKRGLAVERIY